MKLKLKFVPILFLILLGFICACQGGTFKPFVRSRYSLRWRKTTETPKIMDSTTAFATKEGLEKISIKPLEVSEQLTENSMQLTTINALLKTSTHSTDYDYYNNEVDDGEHKN